jgi:predicted acyl esterase
MHLPARTLGVLLAALVLTPAVAQAATAPGNEFTTTPYYIPTSDPTITIHADVMRPAKAKPTDKLPVILSIGPYFNHSGSTITDYPNGANRPGTPNSRFDDLINGARIFEKGYTLVYADLPGFGASTGCNDFGGPNERLGTKAAVEWAAAQPWSNGKVGMWGKSYDGWTQVMALADTDKVAAAVIQSPIIDGYRTLYMNGLHYYAGPTGWYATPAVYQAGDAQPPSLQDDPEYFSHWAQGEIVACYPVNILEQNGFVDKDDPAGFWAARDIVDEASKSKAAVFWSHGFLDENTKPDNFVDVWKNLKGPHRAWFGQYHHVRGNELDQNGRAKLDTKDPTNNLFFEESMRWFAEYLKGEEGAVAGDPPVEGADSEGRWRAEQQWPPADAVTKKMPLKPGSYTDDSGPSAANPSSGAWTFTQPMAEDTRIAGVPRLTVTAETVAPRAALVARLYDVNPTTGAARLISRGGYAVKGNGALSFDLYPQDYKVKKGNVIGLLVTGDDNPWFFTAHSKQSVAVSNGSLSLPVLANERTKFLTSAKSTPAMGSVPKPTIPTATISGNTVKAPDFG